MTICFDEVVASTNLDLGMWVIEGMAICTYVYLRQEAPTKSQQEGENTKHTVLKKVFQRALLGIRVLMNSLKKC